MMQKQPSGPEPPSKAMQIKLRMVKYGYFDDDEDDDWSDKKRERERGEESKERETSRIDGLERLRE